MTEQHDMRMLGVTGLKQFSGYVQEEWLRELQGVRWQRTLRQMVDQDPIIGGILLAIEMLIRQVDWTVVPATEENPDDQAAALFIQEALGAMRASWPDTLAEMLSFLPWGWAVLELCYMRDERGRTVWESWGIRGQDTLQRWEFDSQGCAVGMYQIAPPDYALRYIPLEKAIHLRTTSRKNNPEGRSILRNVYRPWYFGSRIENIEGIGIERDLAGLPIAKVPAEIMSAGATSDQRAVFDIIKNIVTSIRRDEQEGVVWPQSFDQNGNPLYTLELLTTGGRRQFDTSGIIARYDARKAMALLADFILLGHEKVGSYALSSDKTTLFAVALGAFLDTIAATVDTDAFRRLLDLNGMPGSARLMHGDIETADLGVLGQFIERLFKAGMRIFPNPLLEAHLLKQAGMPVVTGQEAAQGDESDEEEEEDDTTKPDQNEPDTNQDEEP